MGQQEAAVDRLGLSEVHHEVGGNSKAEDVETSHHGAVGTSHEVEVVVLVVTSLHGEEPVESLFPEVEVSHHGDEGDLPHVVVGTSHREAVETLHPEVAGISHPGAGETSHPGAVGISHQEAGEILHLVEGAISMLHVAVALLEDHLQLAALQCVVDLH